MNLKKILSYIQPKRVLDIGAHTGGFHDELRQVVPFFQRYFAIEGNEHCEKYLKNKGLETFIGLMGKEEGEKDFFRRKNNPICTGSSVFREISEHYSDEEIWVERKKIFTIDSIFSKDDEFDLVKIDTQGSEIDILQGGKEFFGRCPLILLEVSIKPYNEGAPLYDEVKNFMSDFGFDEVDIIGENKYADGTVFQLDILYKKRDY